MKKVVFLTIGEAPRTDLQMTFDRFFAGMTTVTQEGLLNGLTLEEATARLGSTSDSTSRLTSRFVDGSFLVMDAEKVERALQEKITALEAMGVEVIAILCTGAFHNLKTTTAQLIEPEKITIPFVKATHQGKRFGVLLPLEEQVTDAREKWQLEEQGTFAYASPYAFSVEQFRQAATKMLFTKPEVVVLDCMGYNEEMKNIMEGHLPHAKVVLSNELLFQYVLTLLKEDSTII